MRYFGTSTRGTASSRTVRVCSCSKGSWSELTAEGRLPGPAGGGPARRSVIARDDDYLFGVLHSRAHELWSLSVGNYMGFGNAPRYNFSRTFKRVPFPWPPGEEPPEDDPRVMAIADAARELDRLRRNWLNPEGASKEELKKRRLPIRTMRARCGWRTRTRSRTGQSSPPTGGRRRFRTKRSWRGSSR